MDCFEDLGWKAARGAWVGEKMKEAPSGKATHACRRLPCRYLISNLSSTNPNTTTIASKTPPKGAHQALNSLPPAQHVVHPVGACLPEQAVSCSCAS